MIDNTYNLETKEKIGGHRDWTIPKGCPAKFISRKGAIRLYEVIRPEGFAVTVSVKMFTYPFKVRRK